VDANGNAPTATEIIFLSDFPEERFPALKEKLLSDRFHLFIAVGPWSCPDPHRGVAAIVDSVAAGGSGGAIAGIFRHQQHILDSSSTILDRIQALGIQKLFMQVYIIQRTA